MMRLQSQSMAQMPYAPLGFNASMYSPWAVPMKTTSPVCEPTAPKSTKQRGTKQTLKGRAQEKLDASGFESASTASGEDLSPRQSQPASDDEQDVLGSVASEQEARTTVMLRNVPNQ